MKIHMTWVRLPKRSDANDLGYVFALRNGRVGFDGVKWDAVTADKYEAWHRIPKTKKKN